MPPAIPIATYRLQFTAAFTFDDAAAIVPYLKELGITHIYASPFLKARKGSMHGYDIVDHNAINPELGGVEGFERFSTKLKANDLGLILDFVPNHMGVHYADNKWWLDVLEWGQKSTFADTFDIDWDMLPFRKKPGVLLPILGASYGTALSNGDIKLRYDPADGSFSAWYFEHRLPIAPERYSDILRAVVGATNETGGAGDELLAIAARYRGPNNPNLAKAPVLKVEIKTVTGGADVIAKGIDYYRASPDRPAQTQALHNLLERQNYRLAHWRLATSEINYRRFFDVNSLAGLRVEDRAVFDRIHGLVRRLIAEDKIQGLRLDHIDGLRDPSQYFQRLRQLIRGAQGPGHAPLYLLIEKILGRDEDLPRFADVSGTTGYEWLNAITHVLARQQGLDELEEIWRQASNIPPKFDPVLREAKRRVLETLLASEFTVLTRLLARIAAGHFSTRDYSEDSLRQALELFVLHFPIYRTYTTSAGPNEDSRKLVESVIDQARADWFGAEEGIFDFLRDTLTLDLLKSGQPARSPQRVRRFALKMQQFTGPMMAKSLEDTSFYRYHKLLAFNEVGGEPAAPATSPAEFNQAMATRARDWPHGMTSTATHDTKRGEDARTRILALTELAGEWANAVAKWKVMNARWVLTKGDVRIPSVADEYMIYQALVGAIPDGEVNSTFVERMQGYAQKAIREAKLQTSWLNPNAEYEIGVQDFLNSILDPEHANDFLNSLTSFTSRTSLIGALNSLSQITLKTLSPGVPDFYQGTELWNFSLVDPDNRRSVDFPIRSELLDQNSSDWTELARNWPDGRIKFAWTRELLQLRNQYADVFTHGDHTPLTVSGEHQDHVIAFARTYQTTAVIIVALRHFSPFTQSGYRWADFRRIDAIVNLTNFEIKRSAVSDSNLNLADVLDILPVAVLPATVKSARARMATRAKRMRQIKRTNAPH